MCGNRCRGKRRQGGVCRVANRAQNRKRQAVHFGGPRHNVGFHVNGISTGFPEQGSLMQLASGNCLGARYRRGNRVRQLFPDARGPRPIDREARLAIPNFRRDDAVASFKRGNQSSRNTDADEPLRALRDGIVQLSAQQLRVAAAHQSRDAGTGSDAGLTQQTADGNDGHSP